MKIKFTFKKTIKILYTVVILLGFGSSYFVFNFAKKQVFDSIFVDEAVLAAQAQKNVKDLKINNFNNVIKKIKEKNSPIKAAPHETKKITTENRSSHSTSTNTNNID